MELLGSYDKTAVFSWGITWTYYMFKTSVQFGGQPFQFMRRAEKSQSVRKPSVATARISLARGRMSWIPAVLSLSLCQLDRNGQWNGKPFFSSPFLQYSGLLTGGHSWIALARNIWVLISHSRTVWRVMDCNGRQLERLFPLHVPHGNGSHSFASVCESQDVALEVYSIDSKFLPVSL